MKKPLPKLLSAAAVLLALGILCLGPFPWSGSAAADLTAALEAIHGPAYSGREILAAGEDGAPVALREDLTFSIESSSPVVPRNWLAGLLGLERIYVCRAIFTRSPAGADGGPVQTQRWTYPGLVVAGPGSSLRARLVPAEAACTFPQGLDLFELPALA